MKTTSKKNGNNRRVSYKECVRILSKHKKDLYERYKVKEIGIFGSYARDEQRKRSDLDILVSYEVVPGLLAFISLESYLSKLLKKKVHLTRKEHIPLEVRKRILNEAIIVGSEDRLISSVIFSKTSRTSTHLSGQWAMMNLSSM